MRGGFTRWARVLVALALMTVGAGIVMADVTPVDWFINLTWYKYGGDWGKDKFSQEVENRFGLKLNFVMPAQEGGQQISTMIASGTLTDLLTVESWLDYRSKMAKGGLLASYNDLIDKYDPDFKKILKTDIFNWYQEKDGKTYGFPNFAYSALDLKKGERLPSNTGFVLRSDLYARIGRPDISTPDKFLAALTKVKTDIKTYQGKAILPLQLYEFSDRGSLTADTWIPEYFAVPFEDSKGNWLYKRTQDKYFDGLRFLNDAYRRGLLSPENFSENRDQINQAVASGQVFALLVAPQDFMQQFKALHDADKNATWEGFVLRNYQGDNPVLSDISGFGWLTTSVSKNAKAQDKIIKFLHFLYSDEGQARTFFGWEGETFNWNKDKTAITWTPAYLSAAQDNSAPAKWGIGFMLQQNWLYAMKKLPQSDPWTLFDSGDEYRMKAPVQAWSYDKRAASLKLDPEDPRQNDMTNLSNKIDLYWGKQLPKIITAASADEARKVWQQSVADIKAMGLDKLVAYQNEGYQRAKQLLGQKFAWPGNMK